MNEEDTGFRTVILDNLRNRALRQSAFAKICTDYSALLSQVVALKSEIERLRSAGPSSSKHSVSSGNELIDRLQTELADVYRLKALNDQKLIDCNQKLQTKEQEHQQLLQKYEKATEQLSALKVSNKQLDAKAQEMIRSNDHIRDEYLALQATYNGLESKHKQLEQVTNTKQIKEFAALVDRWVDMKNHEVDQVNLINDQLSKKRDAEYAQALQSAIQQEVVVPVDSALARATAAAPYTIPVDMLPDKCVYSFSAHQAEINTLCWAPNSQHLATGSVDRKIHVWKINPSGKHDKLHTLTGCNQSVMCLEFDANERMLLAASNDMNVRLWTLGDQRLRDVLTGHTSKVSVARFRNQATQIVSGSNDRTIKLWDVRDRRCVKNYFPGSIVNDLVCCDNGCLISGHFDKKLRFWDGRNDSTTNEMQLDGRVTSLQLNSDGRQLLCCTRDDSLVMIDLRMNQRIHTYCGESFHIGSDTTRATLSALGTYCAAGTNDGRLFVWNTATTQIEKTITAGKNPSELLAVAWHPMGWYVAGTDRHGQVHLWAQS